MFFVLTNPTTSDEKDCRYNAWLIAGLKSGEKRDALSPQGKKVIEEVKVKIEDIKKKLSRNKFFEGLTLKQKDAIRNGYWRIGKTWQDIAISEGLNERYRGIFFNYLSAYVHSDSWCIKQVIEARDGEIQKSLSRAALSLVMISMANMILLYNKVFPQTEYVLKDDLGTEELVRMISEIASESLEDQNVNWDDFELK